MKTPLSPASRAAQALHRIDAATGGVVPPIALSTTYARDAAYRPRQDYIYAREGGPTLAHAEAVLADLDGAAASLAFASGMASLVTLTENLAPGVRIAAPRVMYHGAQTWLHRLVERGRIAVTWYDQADPDALARVAEGAAWLWVETPANPTWDIVDIRAAAGAARAAGARLLVDCTAAPPSALQALTLGADVAFHSATKYLGGHSDLLAGVLSFRDADLAAEIRALRALMGNILAPFDAWLLIRGLRTLFLRWERASETALAIAKALDGHPKIAQVLYPGLPRHPGHAIAKAQMQGYGGMLSLLTHDAETAARVARSTKLFLPATSLGGVESLIEHRATVEGPYSVVPDTLLRLSVGIEATDDLIRDLSEALG